MAPVARAVRAASEATRALREACTRGTVPDLELVRELLGDFLGEVATQSSGGRPQPYTPACRSCGAYLMLSARQRADELCDPCRRRATAAQTTADRGRVIEAQAGSTPQPPTAPPGRYLVQDAHNLDRAAAAITASSAAAAARIYAELERRDRDVPDRRYDYVVKDPDGRVFWVRLAIDFAPLAVIEGEPVALTAIVAAQPAQPPGSAPPAASPSAAPAPSRCGLERVRRVNSRRRRVAAAKGSP